MKVYTIEFQDAAGERYPATIALDRSGEDFRITIIVSGTTVTRVSGDYFEGFCEIREVLEAGRGIRPLCFGAARDVYPSGMSRSMGGGIKAYRLKMGRQSHMADLVDIFDSEDGIQPVEVQTQREYFKEWLASL